MARLQKRNLAKPSEVRSVGRGQLEIVEFGDTTIGRMRYEPGWRWSEDLKPLVGGEWCQIRHVGVVLSGHFHVEMEDGATMELLRDDVYEIPPGHDGWVVGDEPWISIDSEGRRYFAKVSEAAEARSLATILLTDIVSSTETAERLGDSAWERLLASYHASATRTIERYRGRQVATTGDGVLALFDSPARAVRCAAETAVAARDLGIEQRAGVHTGEVDHVGADVRGIAVHLAARVAAAAVPGEVLVSATTNVLLAGSGVTTTSRGADSLKGINQPVELFAVDSIDHQAVPR
jgi:class 3 adenylate cyclase